MPSSNHHRILLTRMAVSVIFVGLRQASINFIELCKSKIRFYIASRPVLRKF